MFKYKPWIQTLSTNPLKIPLIIAGLTYNLAIIRGIFKGFVSRAKKLCSKKYLDEELNFLVDMFVEKRHDLNHFYSIIRGNKRQAPKTENADSNIAKLP